MGRRSASGGIVLLLVLLLAGLAGVTRAATFTVNTTADAGAGSLRQAILDANGSPGPDTIAFAIPGAGVHSISVGSPLTITDTIVIDGYTQPGSLPNTDPYADNAIILVDLQGNATDGLVVTGGAAEIHGLALHGFQNAIDLGASGGSFVGGCFVGLSPSGLSVPGNTVGIRSHGTGPDTVGDSNPANRNVISGNGTGVSIDSTGQSIVRNNLIGTNPAGSAAVANAVGVASTTGLALGGNGVGQGNVISGNSGDGVHVTAGPHDVTRNLIGLDVTGLQPLGNGGAGVWANASNPLIEANFVSANGSHGIDLADSSGARVFGNVIGLNVLGLGELGNRGAAIHGHSAEGAFIGPGGGYGPNVMSNNAAGIWVEQSFNFVGLTIGSNKFSRNGGLGIVRGPTLEIPPYGSSFPVITSVVPGATTTTITGFLSSAIRWARGSASTRARRARKSDPGISMRGRRTSEASISLPVPANRAFRLMRRPSSRTRSSPRSCRGRAASPAWPSRPKEGSRSSL